MRGSGEAAKFIYQRRSYLTRSVDFGRGGDALA